MPTHENPGAPLEADHKKCFYCGIEVRLGRGCGDERNALPQGIVAWSAGEDTPVRYALCENPCLPVRDGLFECDCAAGIAEKVLGETCPWCGSTTLRFIGGKNNSAQEKEND